MNTHYDLYHLLQDRIYEDDRLDSKDFSVLNVLYKYCDSYGSNAFPSVDKMAARCKLSRSSVVRSLKKLVDLKVVGFAVRYRDDGGRSTNNYSFTWNWLFAPDSPAYIKWRSVNAEGGKRSSLEPFVHPLEAEIYEFSAS